MITHERKSLSRARVKNAPPVRIYIQCKIFATGCLIKLLPYANRPIQFAQEFRRDDKSSFIDANDRQIKERFINIAARGETPRFLYAWAINSDFNLPSTEKTNLEK